MKKGYIKRLALSFVLAGGIILIGHHTSITSEEILAVFGVVFAGTVRFEKLK